MAVKIAILGYSACGKSTLAQRLGAAAGVPVLHLDCVNWTSGWQARAQDQAQAEVERFLSEHDRWIIEGNYTNLCYARRLAEADCILILQFDRWICLFRACRRYWAYRGRVRDTIAPGCDEKLDGDFLRWILRDGRDTVMQARFSAVCKRYPDKTVRLSTPRELEALCRRLQIPSLTKK